MKKVLLFGMAFVFSFGSNAQGEEKGCSVSGNFSVTYGSDDVGNPISYVNVEAEFAQNLWPQHDTIFIDYTTSDTLRLQWIWEDQLSTLNFQINDQTVSWKKDGAPLTDEFISMMNTEISNGPCGVIQYSFTEAMVTEPGIYTFNSTIQNNYPIVHLRIPQTNETPEITQMDFALYPNPTANELIVRHGINSRGTIDVYSLNGIRMNSHVINGSMESTYLSLGQLATGTYLVCVSFVDGGVEMRKVVKI